METKSTRRDIFLIVICWFTYLLAQLGRYSYSSNLTLIMDKFAVDHASASLPATLFFFAYGIGQICVGFFCHKFNRKLLVVSALVISGVINLLIFFGAEFYTIKFLWFLNGFSQANLWPVTLLILRENLSEKRLVIAGIIMSTASTGGKFAAIGICALFAIDKTVFMYCYLVAGILLFAMAILFGFATGKLKGVEIKEKITVNQLERKPKADKKSIILLLMLFEFSLACYAIMGGLQSWAPAIIKENYGMSDALSIFMSTLLPLFTLPVAFISPFIYKKLKNCVLISLLAFVFGSLLIVGVIFFLKISWLLIMAMLTVESLTMGIISNMTTVQLPLTFKGNFDAGFLAGFLNGACYTGSAIATYVLGYITDVSDWTGAFLLLILIALFSALLAGLYLVYSWKSKRKANTINEGK